MRGSVAGNTSVSPDSAVTGNECAKCAAKFTPNHRACEWCGACPGKGRSLGRAWGVDRYKPYRDDRAYCSSTCRVKAWKHRHDPATIAEREAREATPEFQAMKATLGALFEAGRAAGMLGRERLKALDEAELEGLDVAATKAAAAYMEGATREEAAAREVARRLLRRLEVTAAETGDRCGSCGRPFEPMETVYRAAGNPAADVAERDRVFPSCADCLCRSGISHQATYCDRCRPGGNRTWARWWADRFYCDKAGPDHAGPYCQTCHPRSWRAPRPCEGCERPVVNHVSVRPGYRRDGWYVRTLDYGDEGTWRVFCSERCRRAVFRVEKKLNRQRELVNCATCGERVDARRADSRYCSSACRQRAYRRRKAVTS